MKRAPWFLALACLTACGTNPQQPGDDRSWPSLGMWQASTSRGALQTSAQHEDVKLVVTKVESEAGVVLYDFNEKGSLSRFKDIFASHRRFPPGNYRVEANCVRNTVDITNADNPNYILKTFRLMINLEPNVIVDLVPSPSVAPYLVNGYAALSCQLNPKGLNRVTSEKTAVQFRSE